MSEKKFLIRLFLVAIVFCGGWNKFQAQSGVITGQTKAITTAVPFLLIAPDSRFGALGDAGVAGADDANATHWNLSGLAFTKHKSGVGISYTPWLRQLVPDINLGYLSGYYNIGEKAGVVAGSLRFFSLGEIIFTDDQATETGRFNASEFALDVGYTRKVTDNFSAGVALRFIYSNLAASRGTTFGETKPGISAAGDINVKYTKDFSMKGGAREIPLTFAWGLNLTNMGAKISYVNASNNKDFIPTNLKLGIMLKGALDDFNTISLLIDGNKLQVPSEGGQSKKTLIDGMLSSWGDAPGGFKEEMQEWNLSTGLEYWYNNLLAVRAGWFFEHPEKGARNYITLGAGVRYQVFGLDFAYLASLKQNHPLQNTMRFSLSLNFDSAKNR